jgi:hypothetical protein
MLLAPLLRTTTASGLLSNIAHELKFQIERGRSYNLAISSFAVVVSIQQSITLPGLNSSKHFKGILCLSACKWEEQVFFLFWIVMLLALRPLLAYCASLG